VSFLIDTVFTRGVEIPPDCPLHSSVRLKGRDIEDPTAVSRTHNLLILSVGAAMIEPATKLLEFLFKL
jgi:hypothetical protein